MLACLQIYQELSSLVTFLRVHSNSKKVSYLFWNNTYPNSKTTCHIKPKFFLWTKLLENLLLAKYLISVTAPLNQSKLKCFMIKSPPQPSGIPVFIFLTLLSFLVNATDLIDKTEVLHILFFILFYVIKSPFFTSKLWKLSFHSYPQNDITRHVVGIPS